MITILHNPRCSTSRAALEALEQAGVAHEVVRYLETPLNELAVMDLFDLLEDPFGDLVRHDKTFEGRGLTDDDVDTKEKIAALLSDDPRLMQRPVLIADEKKAIIGRPKDRVPAFIEEFGTPASESTAVEDEVAANVEEEEAAAADEA